jgi:hypothetical protein
MMVRLLGLPANLKSLGIVRGFLFGLGLEVCSWPFATYCTATQSRSQWGIAEVEAQPSIAWALAAAVRQVIAL